VVAESLSLAYEVRHFLALKRTSPSMASISTPILARMVFKQISQSYGGMCTWVADNGFLQVASLASASAPHLLMWAVQHLQFFTVQTLEELSLLFMLAQHGTWQFLPCCIHRYASVVSPPSPCLCESGGDPYSVAPTALCSSVSGEHQSHVVRPNCALIASASAAAPRLCPLQLLLLQCVRLLPRTRSTKYNKYEGHTSLL